MGWQFPIQPGNCGMPLHVLIAPDKFKGTLTARQAALAIARGWRRVRPRDKLKLLPISDGGEGFGEAMAWLTGARPRRVRTVDAAGQKIEAIWWWEQESRMAIVESAKVIGLARLPPGKLHPFQLSTYGLGALLKAAQATGAKCTIIGIGGSATNDGGFGLGLALGWRFVDKRGEEITSWTGLPRLARIIAPAHSSLGKIIVAVDVQNKLLGHQGATRIYGPQKGIRNADVARAERCLQRLAAVWRKNYGRDLAVVRGAGAAGGLGFGLMACADAIPQPGFRLFAEQANLAAHLSGADLVVTGEGTLDESSLMGKGVGELAKYCVELGIPCVGICGSVRSDRRLRDHFSRVHAILDITSMAAARRNPGFWLARLTKLAADEFIGVGGGSCRTRRLAKSI
jgi:glycerate kinase